MADAYAGRGLSVRSRQAGLFLALPHLGHLFGLPSCLPGRTDTGWTALLAGADIDRLQAVLEEVLLQVEKRRAQPDAAGEVVVDEDVGLELRPDEDQILVEGSDPKGEVPGRHGLAGQVVAYRFSCE